ncbi:hypothetical protein JAAARDRAFT_30031 [Jaapia argillacea MUCL 33604]|uniref:F-box domain-containing protein n=1 Tax=Jaapia argillacea MUCL 33604 TaxID=933084 RepID=A0A067Q567_9AGAM|nr:hypothetical protein JAAARDRAFT_30031 [Jaapia argillacea MUCL 33604]
MGLFRNKPTRLNTVHALDRCPPEICEEIFTLACMDGGYTGRSLSLVSKYIRNASETVRFQSIAVSGLAQVRALAAVLEGASAHPHHVRHLFLSYCDPSRSETPREARTSSNPGWPNIRGRFRRRQSYVETPSHGGEGWDKEQMKRLSSARLSSERIQQAVTRIFRIVGHSLETLTMVMPQSRGSVLPAIPLPVLTELTVYSIWGDQTTYITPTLPYPSLRRLHLAGRYFHESQIPEIASACPSLTHLRLSGLEDGIHLPRPLKAILGLPHDIDKPHPIPTSLRHPSLQRVLVQPRPPAHFSSLLAYDIYRHALSGVPALLHRHREEDIILLKPVIWGDIDDCVADAKALWLDRLEGGLGCWVEKTRTTADGFLSIDAPAF